MAVASEMSLPLLPVDKVEFAAEPQRWLEPAQRQHPWLGRFSNGYAVYGLNAVSDLLSDSENLMPGMKRIVDFYDLHDHPWGHFMSEIVLAISGPTHKRIKSSVGDTLSVVRANQARPLMQKVITELLDEWAPKSEFNFADFASFFPVTVMCGLLGISPKAVPGLRHAVEGHLASLLIDRDMKPVFLAAWEDLWKFADTTVTEAETSGKCQPESILGTLIQAKKAGQLDETELRFMFLTVFAAGYDTSKNMLSMIMLLLLDRPEMYARCAVDKAFCGKVVQEALRHSSIGTAYREVKQNFSYDGVEFRKGELLCLFPPLAGRDPTIFPDPMKFDVNRVNNCRHVAFSRGEHFCMGLYVAMAQIQEGLHLITQRLKNPRLNGEVKWRGFLGTWGPSELPIKFDRV